MDLHGCVTGASHGTSKSLVQMQRAYKVEFNMLDGTNKTVSLEEGETMLEAMIEAGLNPSHDCKMGVCMTCPARLVCCETLWVHDHLSLWHSCFQLPTSFNSPGDIGRQ
jgi:hypothetical protein